jgi:flagellar protein FliO/FliZ
MIQFFGILLFGCLLGSTAWSQSVNMPKTDAGMSHFGAAWLVLVTLSLLVVLIVLIWWFFRHQGAGRTQGAVKILAAQVIGPRERILIVRIEDRILALGQTAQQINVLVELDTYTDASPQVPHDQSPFSKVLNQIVTKVRS